MTDENRSLAIIPKSIDECASLAERLSKSELLPKALRGKVPDVLMTIMAGQEIGLAPMVSLRTIHIIEGQPRLSADAMVAIVLGSGKAIYFDRVEESDASVTYETCRVGSKTPRRCTWTMEMAKRAALHLKDNWRAHPRAMLAARAKSELARDVYPDVLAGCYTNDEIPSEGVERLPVQKHTDAVDAEIVNESSSSMDLLKALETVETYAQNQELLKRCKEIPQSDPLYQTIRKAWKSNDDRIKARAKTDESQLEHPMSNGEAAS